MPPISRLLPRNSAPHFVAAAHRDVIHATAAPAHPLDSFGDQLIAGAG
jgi:hypothetical protein